MLYVHIPFCRSRCVYCAFHSGTDLSLRQRYVQAVCHELHLQRNWLNDNVLRSIYFGGGTPSLLTIDELRQIFDTIFSLFSLADNTEITLECNPDDLTENFVKQLATLPFNRVSMGVQSFDNDELRFLRRRHSAEQAKNAIELLQKNGFQNISIDLMFGLPTQTLDSWQHTLNQAVSLGVQHISAYSLSYEKGTSLTKMLNKGHISELDEEVSLTMFEQLISTLKNSHFEQYEISNFAKKGFRSQHNSAYWKGVAYLGVGAGAHSFDGKNCRQWNVENTFRYIESVEKSVVPCENERLSPDELYDEYIFTHLRTVEGLNLDEIGQKFGENRREYCQKQAKSFVESGKLRLENERLKLTHNGIFVSDSIAVELFS